MLVKDLLEDIPSNTMDIVEQTTKTWNHKIRSQLSTKLLRWQLKYSHKQNSYKATIDVKSNKIGIPTRLADLKIPSGYERAARLAVYAPASRQLTDAALRLLPLFTERDQIKWVDTSIQPDMAKALLQGAISLGKILEELATPPTTSGRPFDLVKFILEINEDVLGAYIYHPTSDSLKGTVELYWGVIGLIAGSLDIDIQALTIVVLAHELAHGYTHLGCDRNGCSWKNLDFQKSESKVKEALAQYYTHHICEYLDGVVPDLYKAYWTLLERQPYKYHLHLPLLLGSTPESVAAAMATLRKEPVQYDQLIGRLEIDSYIFDDGIDNWRRQVEHKRTHINESF